MGRDNLSLNRIRVVVDGAAQRLAKARRVAELIRSAGAYRWVGIYDVEGAEIAVIAWSGPGEPANPRFPVTQGLCGAAVSSCIPVVVGDVTIDQRSVPAFNSTRSEIVVPVIQPGTGQALGVVDVESERLNAFTDDDRLFLERCASVLARLWQ